MPEPRTKWQIILSEGVVLAVIGLAFYAGIMTSQVSDLRKQSDRQADLSAAHITRDEFRREMVSTQGSPERLARLEAQMAAATAALQRIERRLDER